MDELTCHCGCKTWRIRDSHFQCANCKQLIADEEVVVKIQVMNQILKDIGPMVRAKQSAYLN